MESLYFQSYKKITRYWVLKNKYMFLCIYFLNFEKLLFLSNSRNLNINETINK